MTWNQFEKNLDEALKDFPRLKRKPSTLVILGSGLSSVGEQYECFQKIEFQTVPHHPVSSVAGHPGKYVLAFVGEETVVFSLGRVHLYEGYHPLEVVFGIALWKHLGIKQLILTNAAGGIGEFPVGSIVAIRDIINHQNTSPLIGCPYPQRFTPMIESFEPKVISFLEEKGIPNGIYAGVIGPQYETPAEIQALMKEGATLVGMSTVQEAIMARYLGLRLCGLSIVTNRAAGLGNHKPDHNNVLNTAAHTSNQLASCIKTIVDFWS